MSEQDKLLEELRKIEALHSGAATAGERDAAAEARWGGKPIGFGHPAKPQEGVHLELYWFNSRLILALLGEDSEYVHSEIAYQPYLIQ